MNNFKTNKLAWCLTDGSAGTISQVRGLAEALALNYELKEVKLIFPWNKLPVGLLPITKMMFKNLDDFYLESKLPDIIISCGKRSIYASLFIKKNTPNKIFSIHIQNPKIKTNNFDIIVAPSHDKIAGNNVIVTDLAINHVTPKLLDKHAQQMSERFASIQKPICTILIGGHSRNYKFDYSTLMNLGESIDNVIKNNDVRLFILFSRRTDKFIKEYLINKYSDKNYIWQGKENPYLALLHYSKFIICTSDSVSMISESISAHKSVYIFKLPSLKKNNRIENFILTILKKNYARILKGKLNDYSNPYNDETNEVVKNIIERYNKKYALS